MRVGIAFVLAALPLMAQNPPGVHFKLRTASGSTTVRQGEALHILLSLSSEIPHRYWATTSNLERECLRDGPPWTLTPSAGWSDALEAYFMLGGCVMDRFVGDAPLSEQPLVLDLPLHEWVRFDQPGAYTLTTQYALRQTPGAATLNRPTVTVLSAPLTLTVAPAYPAWQLATLREASVLLNHSDARDAQPPERHALELLGALGTVEAERLLARWAANDPRGLSCRAIVENGHLQEAAAEMRAAMTMMPQPPPDAAAACLQKLNQLTR